MFASEHWLWASITLCIRIAVGYGCVPDQACMHVHLPNSLSILAGMSKEDVDSPDSQTDWEAAWKALLWSLAIASAYTLLASWIPAIHSFPVATWVGLKVVTDWGWEVTPSMGYIGQGMIMGPKTAFSMLAGAVVGRSSARTDLLVAANLIFLLAEILSPLHMGEALG